MSHIVIAMESLMETSCMTDWYIYIHIYIFMSKECSISVIDNAYIC